MIKTKNNNLVDPLDIKEDLLILKELNKLPPSYFIFNDVCLRLSRPVRYRKTERYVKSARINYIVIGPTGIFIIGFKDGGVELLKDVDIAGLIFYIKTVNWFHGKLPIYNVAIRIKKVPKIKYGFIYHLTAPQLRWFILRREGRLSKRKIRRITSRLSRITVSKKTFRKKISFLCVMVFFTVICFYFSRF